MNEHHLPKGTDSTTKFYAELIADHDRLAAENAELVKALVSILKSEPYCLKKAYDALAKVKEGE